MERAGSAVAEAVSRDYPGARVVAVCGKGANGGDGRIAARKLGAEVVEVGADLPAADVVIDAIFGTGFHGEPREEAARSIEAIRHASVPVVAVDVPSGVNASTGEVSDVCVEATTTVTFHGEKVGLAVAPGSLHAGTVEVADIGLEYAETRHARVTSEIVRRLPKRRRDGNKYRSGSVLVVGGAPGMTGRLRAARGAARRRDAPAGGGQAAPRGSLRGGGARPRARTRARTRARRRSKEPRPAAAGGHRPAGGRRRRRALSLRAGRAGRHDSADTTFR